MTNSYYVNYSLTEEWDQESDNTICIFAVYELAKLICYIFDEFNLSNQVELEMDHVL